jgi:hypothetical protein
VTINFPVRGIHDNKQTPAMLYNLIINKLKFIDVCLDKNKFSAISNVWPDKSYCNPPFSNKTLFIARAIESNRHGNEVLLYLPFDPTTKWFQSLYYSNVLILVFMKRMMHAKFPHALYHLKDYSKTNVVLLHDEHDALKYLR